MPWSNIDSTSWCDRILNCILIYFNRLKIIHKCICIFKLRLLCFSFSFFNLNHKGNCSKLQDNVKPIKCENLFVLFFSCIGILIAMCVYLFRYVNEFDINTQINGISRGDIYWEQKIQLNWFFSSLFFSFNLDWRGDCEHCVTIIKCHRDLKATLIGLQKFQTIPPSLLKWVRFKVADAMYR